ncbi:MAG: hypothetical protein AAF587_07635 [Bacteroidota bacterium]
MKRFIIIIGYICLVLILTLLTQVGGLILIGCLPLLRRIRKNISQTRKRRLLQMGTFLGIYLLFTCFLIPPLARIGGRVPLPLFGSSTLKPLNAGTYFLNRQYVTPALKQLLLDSSEEMTKRYPGSIVAYMDANHPFGNGYPLVPHLSHKDGKKVDIAFFYRKKKNQKAVHRRALTWIGYGGCELPKAGEFDQPSDCRKRGYWQYSLLYLLSPPWIGRRLELDSQRTKTYLEILAKNRGTGKIFLEPHLKTRLGMSHYTKVRFHGCHAVRHDDHIHLQL